MNTLNSIIKKIDKEILKVMNNGLVFSFVLSVIATIILCTYLFIYQLPIIFHFGFTLLKSSIFFAVFFIIFAVAFNTFEQKK